MVIALNWTATVEAAWKRAAAHRHRKDGTPLCKVRNQKYESETRERIMAKCTRMLIPLAQFVETHRSRIVEIQ